MLLVVVASLGCTGSSDLNSDQDGISGGDFTFVITTSDTAFQPTVIKAQNKANVTVTLENASTAAKPHGFRVEGIDGALIAPVAPGASATVKFTTPDREGIYTIDSPAPGDTMQAQLVVQ
jgi:FtsP/CotA-like multicopper oxidase with cupredoxin domain